MNLVINALKQIFQLWWYIDPTEYVWAHAETDEGRTLLLAWGLTEESAQKKLSDMRNKSTIMHPNGILKVMMPNDVDWIPDAIVLKVADHMGCPLPEKLKSSKPEAQA